MFSRRMIAPLKAIGQDFSYRSWGRYRRGDGDASERVVCGGI